MRQVSSYVVGAAEPKTATPEQKPAQSAQTKEVLDLMSLGLLYDNYRNEMRDRLKQGIPTIQTVRYDGRTLTSALKTEPAEYVKSYKVKVLGQKSVSGMNYGLADEPLYSLATDRNMQQTEPFRIEGMNDELAKERLWAFRRPRMARIMRRIKQVESYVLPNPAPYGLPNDAAFKYPNEEVYPAPYLQPAFDFAPGAPPLDKMTTHDQYYEFTPSAPLPRSFPESTSRIQPDDSNRLQPQEEQPTIRNASVAGILGPSDAEKAEAKAIMERVLTGYLNNVIALQTINRRMREFRQWAEKNKKSSDPKFTTVMEGLKSSANGFSKEAHKGLEYIKAWSKKDPGIFEKIDYIRIQLEKKLAEKDSALKNITVKTSKGTEFKITSTLVPASGVGNEVGGLIPLVFVLATVAVVSVSGTVVASVLTAPARAYAKTITSSQKSLIGVAEEKIRLADEYMKLDKRLAEKKITPEQHSQEKAGLDKAMQVLDQTEKSLPKPADVPPPAPPVAGLNIFGMVKPFIIPAVVAGGAYTAWRMGLFKKLAKAVNR